LVGALHAGTTPRTAAALAPNWWVIAGVPMAISLVIPIFYYVMFQILQLFLAAAVYHYLKDGKAAPGFEAADFDHVSGLRACGLRSMPSVRQLLHIEAGAPG
jgi:hypothetical protein